MSESILPHQLISRDDALTADLKMFFTGLPCQNGHISERYVSNYSCQECLLTLAGRPRRLDPPKKIKETVGRPKLEYVSYEEARAWVRKFRFKSWKEWFKFRKKRDPKTGKHLRPAWIPNAPERAYKNNGWVSGEDYFGFGRAALFSYAKAKMEARKLGLKSRTAWRVWWRQYRPVTVPCAPELYYKEWENWNEFLGNRNVFNTWKPQLVSYEQAKKIVHPLKFRNQTEYFEWHKANRPYNLPFHPAITYKKRGWESWTKFLGRKVADRLESKSVNTAVWYIVHHPGLPDNVIEVSIDGVGKKIVLQKVKQKEFILLKIYKYEVASKPQVEAILNEFSTSYWEDRKQRICSNISQMLFELDQLLEWA